MNTESQEKEVQQTSFLHRWLLSSVSCSLYFCACLDDCVIILLVPSLSLDESASASLSFSQSFTHRWSSKEGRDKFASESRHQSRLSCCQSSFFSGSFTWRMYTRRGLRILPLFTFFYYTSFVFSVSLCSLISGFIPSVAWSFCQKMPVSSTCCWVFRCLDAQVVVLWQDKFPDDVSWLSLSHWMKEKVKSRQVQSSQENPGFLGLWLLLLKFIPSLTLLWCHNPWSGLLHCQRIKKVIELLQNIKLETRIRISSLGIKDREDGLSSEDTFSLSLVFHAYSQPLITLPFIKRQTLRATSKTRTKQHAIWVEESVSFFKLWSPS